MRWCSAARVELFTDAALSKAVYPALESLQIRLGHHTETALSIHLSGPHRDSAVWTGATAEPALLVRAVVRAVAFFCSYVRCNMLGHLFRLRFRFC